MAELISTTGRRKNLGKILTSIYISSGVATFFLLATWFIALGSEQSNIEYGVGYIGAPRWQTSSYYSYLPVILNDSDFPGPDVKGELDFEELVISNLESGAVDIWALEIDSSMFVTITVAPASSTNILISVLDENGKTVVDRQDKSPAGEVETISKLSLTSPGLYQVQIISDPAEKSNYALMVMNTYSYNFDFRGTLGLGELRTDSLPEKSDHFWFFSASDGETISLRVSPKNQGDVYLELYGTNGSRLLTIDSYGSGKAEALENYSILATGMYGIRVGEFDFAAMSYDIVVYQ